MDLHPALLITFTIIIVVMMLLDLGVFNKKDHVISTKEAGIWTIVWIALSMLFSVFVYYDMGMEAFVQYQSAYWIEKSLSIDNLFVFLLVFNQFSIPKHLQHRVLFFGIIGAVIFRAIFILVGIELIHLTYLSPITIFGIENVRLNLVLMIFGLFLLISGVKALVKKQENSEQENLKEGWSAKLVGRFFKITNEFDGHKFFTIKNGIKMATPLFVALIVIEFSDLIFAVDSIPAIFSISQDPIILYTSNIFAILGLRSMYFILSSIMDTFRHLKIALSFILMFIGTKMIIEPFHIEIDSLTSLLIICSILIFSVFTSIIFKEKPKSTQE